MRIVDSGQGCCWTPYSEQDSPPQQRVIQLRMSVGPSLRTLGETLEGSLDISGKAPAHLCRDCVAEWETRQWLSQSLAQAQRQLLVLWGWPAQSLALPSPDGTRNPPLSWNEWGNKIWIEAKSSNMDGPRDYHTKWSQTERQISYKLTYLQNRNRLTDIENKLMVPEGERG